MGSYVRQGGGGRRRRSGRARGPPRVWAFADRSFSVGRGGCLSVGGWACLSLDGGEVAWNSRGACGARRSNAGPAGGARRVWKVARVGRGRTRFRPPGVVRVRAGLGGRVEGAELVEEELVVLAHLLHAEQLVLAFLGRRRRPAGAAVPRLLLLGELGDGGELGGLGGLGGGDGGVGGRGGGGRLGGRGGGGRLGGRGGRDGLRGGLRERARRRESRAGTGAGAPCASCGAAWTWTWRRAAAPSRPGAAAGRSARPSTTSCRGRGARPGGPGRSRRPRRARRGPRPTGRRRRLGRRRGAPSPRGRA